MEEKEVIYTVDGQEYLGYIAHIPDDKVKKPGVLVAHAWMGQDEFAKNKARELAKLGYIGFATDQFGKGLNAQSAEEASELIAPLVGDRALLQKRIGAGYQALAEQEIVDENLIGAIGYCFGGLTAIELLRSGKKVRGVVSFHGVLGAGDAKTVPISESIMGEALILHGSVDPLSPIEDVLALQSEFNEHGISWQSHIFGQTAHAFTNPKANQKEMGLIYNNKSSDRAWKLMKDFLEEIFT